MSHDMSMYDANDLGAESTIAFSAFGPQHCPNLRHFRVSEYRKDVHKLLAQFASDESFSNRLAVRFDVYSDFDPARLLRRNPQDSNPPTPVRMLLGLYLGLPDSEPSDNWGWVEPREDSTVQALDDLISCNADTLEGLAVTWRDGWYDWDSQIHLFKHFETLRNAMSKLPHLCQPGINPHRLELRGNWPVWSYPMPKRNVELAIELLARAAPKLTYIAICSKFWRIGRREGGNWSWRSSWRGNGGRSSYSTTPLTGRAIHSSLR